MPQPRSSISRRPRRSSQLVRPRKTNAGTSEEAAAGALTLQFLDFIADGRTYGETMEAWRSTCPRHTVWEDAFIDGLVQIEGGGPVRQSAVTLTARGRAVLGGNEGP